MSFRLPGSAKRSGVGNAQRMNIATWLQEQGGIAHRKLAQQHGFSPKSVQLAARRGDIIRLNTKWICLGETDATARAAACAGGKISCVSLARERGWFIPEGIDTSLHLHMPPRGHTPSNAIAHWTEPLAPSSEFSLRTSVFDALAHIATCVRGEPAQVIWESAVRIELIAPEMLATIEFKSDVARYIVSKLEYASDSGLETMLLSRIRQWPVAVRQQVVLLGRPVDVVLGTHLVVQVDGYEFHQGSAQRTKDIAHDAALRLRGFTVFRFSYEQIMYRWHEVERILITAIAQQLHLAPELRAR